MKTNYRMVCVTGCHTIQPLESKKSAGIRASEHVNAYHHEVAVVKEAPPKKTEWKQGFLVVPAVDVFKPDTIRQTLEWFNGQTGRN